MSEALAQWVEQLQQQTLPVLKANLELLKQLSTNERCDLGQLADIIESDPGLSVLLMRHVNTIRQKNGSDDITTPRHALMMLGLQPLRLLLSNAVVAEETLEQQAQQRLRRLYCRAYHAAWQSRALGELRRDFEVEELFAAALLGGLGEMMLSLHAAQELARVDALVTGQGLPLEQAQRQVFGFPFAELTLGLARAWKQPFNLYRDDHTEAVMANRVLNVRMSLRLAHHAEQGWYTPTMRQLLENISEFSGQPEARLATQAHLSSVDAARQSLVFQQPHPAAQLLYPLEPEATEKPAAKRRDSLPEWPSLAQDAICLAPQRQVLAQVVKHLQQTGEKLTAAQVIKLACQGMHHGLGLNRVVFASADGGQLKPLQLLDNEEGGAFKQFAIELDGHNLFSRLLEKPQSLWLDDDNRKKFFPIIPINFHKLIDNDSFFVMSLFVNDKPVGLFYADRTSKNCRLNDEAYKRFKQLVVLAGKQLAASA